MLTSLVASKTPIGLETDWRDHHLRALDAECQAHPAVNHVWLENVAAHRYPDMKSTIRGFARDYQAYSSGFPTYLRKLIGKLECRRHKEILQRNLREEQGVLDSDDRDELRAAAIEPADIEGVSHPELYRRFCHAMGLDDAELGLPGTAGYQWRQRMIAYLDQASVAGALGALGPGTESVVRPVYHKLLRGIRGLGDLEPRDHVFFDLHCTMDDQHALDLKRVAYDLADTPHARRDMRQGMLEALRLRQAFFSHQHIDASGRLMKESR